ncbi:MAG: TolC family protein [Myxococcota bacterium]
MRELLTLLRMEPADDLALRVDAESSGVIERDYTAAVARALENREDLKRVEAVARSRALRRDATFWRLLPDVNIRASARRARPNPRILPPVDEFRGDWQVGVAVSWSPTDFLVTRAQKQSADAEVSRSSLEAELYRDRIRNEVARALDELESAMALQGTAVVELEAAREGYRVRRAQYPAGIATLSNVIDTEAELIEAELRLLNASVRSVLAKEQLNRSLGLTLSTD